MAGRSSAAVAGLTVAALAGIGFLAFQASASAPDHLTPAHHSGASPSPSSSAPPKGKGGPGKPGAQAAPAVPADSGTGRRVVYALDARRVWLVGEDGKARRSYEVTPSTVSPSPGSYAVTTRTETTPGSDGIAVVHVVRFALVEGVTIGFSAAQDGSTPAPDPQSRTGGVRESLKDAEAMWRFAPTGTKVVVVP
ncbi:L,D-transpeptidase [Streptomyces sp. NPDC007088]|uniref:L,D-transpeptidase n=1 Tax=Streptomyces sp. NPDC007088 TaxID=3364773 RepID=UPI0036C749F8